MCYLVNVNHKDMAVQWMGMLGASVRKMKALTVKMETATLIGTGRQNLTLRKSV
jgi:hypothetical protein